MDYYIDIKGFTNQCRLFPLPGLVLLPHAVLPLHIFEPRYRQMTRDALDSDQLIAMVLVRPAPSHSPWTEPVPIMDVACLGKIVQHERLPDGRYNMLLLGCRRVALVREIPTGKLYRTAEARVLAEVETPEHTPSRRRELIALFRKVVAMKKPIDPDLSKLLDSPIRLGALADVMAHALGLPSMLKQGLLAEPAVEARLTVLRSVLERLVGREPESPPFPPPFSLN